MKKSTSGSKPAKPGRPAKRKSPARREFRTELLTGHKGAAVIVPFDPAETWGTRPVLVASKAYGRRPGHLIRARLNGHSFDGWIGRRWGRFFVLVDESVREAAGVSVGEIVDIVLEPRAPGETAQPKPRRAPRANGKPKP